MWKKIKPYVFSVLIALAVGGLSALLTSKNMDLYDDVIMPKLSPPSIVFPIVWSILFILMGISSAIIYKHREFNRSASDHALIIYGANLLLNFFWNIIFFNMRNFLFAFVWLVLLWGTILAMIIRFSKINKVAGYLQIPYLLWVTFAGYLNLAIYLLN